MIGLFKNMFAGPNQEELASSIKAGAFLVDVRSAGEFAGGSVKGAVNIPLDKVPSQLAKFKGKSSVIVFCASGNRSGQAQRFLEQNGISNVYNGGSWGAVRSLVNSL